METETPKALEQPSEETGELTVRDQIRKGLGEKWTRELEDALFWPLSELVSRAWKNGHNEGSAEMRAHAEQLIGCRIGISSTAAPELICKDEQGRVVSESELQKLFERQ